MNVFLVVGGENVTSRQSGKVAFPNSVRSGSSRQSFLSGMYFVSCSKFVNFFQLIGEKRYIVEIVEILLYSIDNKVENPSPTLYPSPKKAFLYNVAAVII